MKLEPSEITIKINVDSSDAEQVLDRIIKKLNKINLLYEKTNRRVTKILIDDGETIITSIGSSRIVFNHKGAWITVNDEV